MKPDLVIIVDYDPGWVTAFETLRNHLAHLLGDFPVRIEHVGSTSIPGVAAKPIIDIDVIVRSTPSVRQAIQLLSKAGYRHVGNLGIKGREAFESPAGFPAHHLYVVVAGNSENVRHLIFRDYLRNHPEEVRKYSRLKKSLARKFRNHRDAYTEGKTGFVEEILLKAQMRHKTSA